MKHFLLLFAVCFLCCNNSEVETLPVKDYNSFHKEAKEFCKENGYNESYYFLVDLSLHSGKNRFFIYDFTSKKVLDKNLVTQGSCDQIEENPDKRQNVKFDDRIDRNCLTT